MGSDTKVVGVEFAGVGTRPEFVVIVDGKYKHMPIRTGISLINDVTEKNNIEKFAYKLDRYILYLVDIWKGDTCLLI